MPGHTLVITREHFATLEDVPPDLLAPFFGVVQRVSRVFGPALGAEGTLVAINTRVSQSVPHVHAHVVPRRKGDRLFSTGAPPMLWIRRRYEEGEAEAIAAVRLIPAARVGLTATFEPVVAAVAAWVVLGERLEAPQIVGGLVVLGAIVVAQSLRPTAGSV